jgi:hypothetical protein
LARFSQAPVSPLPLVFADDYVQDVGHANNLDDDKKTPATRLHPAAVRLAMGYEIAAPIDLKQQEFAANILPQFNSITSPIRLVAGDFGD